MRPDTYHPQVAKWAKNIPRFGIPRFPEVIDMFNLLSIWIQELPWQILDSGEFWVRFESRNIPPLNPLL